MILRKRKIRTNLLNTRVPKIKYVTQYVGPLCFFGGRGTLNAWKQLVGHGETDYTDHYREDCV